MRTYIAGGIVEVSRFVKSIAIAYKFMNSANFNNEKTLFLKGSRFVAGKLQQNLGL